MLDGGEGQLVELALALGKERSVLRAQQGARDGIRARAMLKGLPPNMKSPYGYRWENDRLVADESYGVVCDIWKMALSGWTLGSIARELTRRGIPTPAGRLGWGAQSVVYILKRRTYAGVIEALKTEAVEPQQRKKQSYGKTSTRIRPESERIPLAGLVEHPIVSETEFEWMQERLRENQRMAQKNTKLRHYPLKGRIRCASCGGSYVGVTRNNRSYYYCRKRWKPGPTGDKCRAPRFDAPTIEDAVYNMVKDFLRGPSAFEAELQRRQGISAETAASLERQLESLEKQEREEKEAEARAFRLATRGNISEDVFHQEIGLIRTKQGWIVEQKERVGQQLADIRRHSVDPLSIGILRERLGARLETATPEDRRFILDAVGAIAIAQADGTWELELQVPQSSPEPVQTVYAESRLG